MKMEELLRKIQENDNIQKIYGLRFDTLFKSIFKDKQLLEALFLYAFHEIVSIQYLGNTEIAKDNIHLKSGICDLLVETPKERILLEIQNKNLHDFHKRLARYHAHIIVSQKCGEDYSEMKPVKRYLIINYIEGENRILKDYTLSERSTDEQFDNLSDTKVWSIKRALMEPMDNLDYKLACLFTLDKLSKPKAIEVLKKYLNEELLREFVEKTIVYNLDVDTYQKLREEEFMFEESFELITSGWVEFKANERAQEIAQELAQEIAHKEVKKIVQEKVKKGKLEANLETAKNLLSFGIPLEIVKSATNLSEQQMKHVTTV